MVEQSTNYLNELRDQIHEVENKNTISNRKIVTLVTTLILYPVISCLVFVTLVTTLILYRCDWLLPLVTDQQVHLATLRWSAM